MPINKPSLKLSLSLLNAGSGYETFENQNLRNRFSALHNQMRQMPGYHFKEASDAPDYTGICQSGFFAISQGFRLYNHNEDIFVHACRETPHYKGAFSGDKFHISVLNEQLPQAFQALSGLLFSEESPVDKWKVTDMARVAQPSRVSVGAQFTLYIKPDQGNSQYSVALLHKTRQFLECLESSLSEYGVMPGQRPESDVHPENWRYLSYRNERRSDREGGEIQSQALREEPFYRLMTE